MLSSPKHAMQIATALFCVLRQAQDEAECKTRISRRTGLVRDHSATAELQPQMYTNRLMLSLSKHALRQRRPRLASFDRLRMRPDVRRALS